MSAGDPAPLKVVVLDYGSGNLRSAQRALAAAGAEVSVSADFATAMAADGLVVPGVGAFAACMAGFERVRGPQIVDKRLIAGRPVLAICVGMQIMFQTGVEHGVRTAGLGEWPGVVEALDAPVLPHMGWNTVSPPPESRLFAGLAKERFYFVHSYGVRRWSLLADGPLRPPLVTWANHGCDFVAAVENGPLSATQFHPEKSAEAGLALLRNWLRTIPSDLQRSA
ncbi:MAG: imidazole glycerol phosphate synthase subunit HisH [Candidatus Nanopelagicales bacterium]